jgi:hypothetical protein
MPVARYTKRLRPNNKIGMTVLQNDPHSVLSLTATELLYADAKVIAKSPYHLHQACQVNISAHYAKPAFMYVVNAASEKKRGNPVEESLPTYFRDFCANPHSNTYTLEFVDTETVRWSDTVNQLSYDRHVSWLIKPVEEIARELAGALRATVKECKLVTVRGAEPFISVSLSPI